ncbi:hypothetical protein Ae201684P_010830 [Aphanomyces euteiches]|nr:hypothetical protein Ae201684P_010830 [Aphanomyces euteiches]
MQASSEAFSREHPLLNRCLGAVDGTHIPVRVPDSLKDRYRNRKGGYTTNVLGVVGEIGRFLAVYAGAEGCASDGFVLRSSGFESTVPSGYFYLADAGLGLSLATLTPFRRTRYHLREWATTPQGGHQLQTTFAIENLGVRSLLKEAMIPASRGCKQDVVFGGSKRTRTLKDVSICRLHFVIQVCILSFKFVIHSQRSIVIQALRLLV